MSLSLSDIAIKTIEKGTLCAISGGSSGRRACGMDDQEGEEAVAI
jgi:hypothetical protein